MKKVITVLAVVMVMLFIITSCGASVPANTVFSVDDLPGKTIGTQLGTTGDLCASAYESQGSTVERYNKGADAVQALKQGKIDCVIIDLEPAKVFVENNPDLKLIDGQFDPEEYAIGVAKENAELLAKINAALAELKSNGTLDNITKNYIGDEKGQYPYVSPENVDRSNGTLVMATNAEFEPYEYYENGVIVGYDVDMAQAVADYLGMELRIDNMDFDAIITAVTSGKADIAVAGLTILPDRLESINFSDTYTTSHNAIIVRAK